MVLSLSLCSKMVSSNQMCMTYNLCSVVHLLLVYDLHSVSCSGSLLFHWSSVFHRDVICDVIHHSSLNQYESNVIIKMSLFGTERSPWLTCSYLIWQSYDMYGLHLEKFSNRTQNEFSLKLKHFQLTRTPLCAFLCLCVDSVCNCLHILQTRSVWSICHDPAALLQVWA